MAHLVVLVGGDARAEWRGLGSRRSPARPRGVPHAATGAGQVRLRAPGPPPPGQKMDEILTMWVIFVEMNILLHTVSLVYSLGRLPRPPFCPAATFFGSHIAHVLMARSRSKLRREHVRSPCPSHAPPARCFPDMRPLPPPLGAFDAHDPHESREPFGVVNGARSRPIRAERCGGRSQVAKGPKLDP